MDDLEGYLRQSEPGKAERAKLWRTAIGLQQVDGLKPSEYLIATAKLHIEGDITINEVIRRIDRYHEQRRARRSQENRDVDHIDPVKAQSDTVNTGNDTANDPVKGRNDLVNDPVKRSILQQLERDPKANYSALAARTGYSAATIKRHIQVLKRTGVIERIGSDKTGHWKIIEP